MQDVQNIQPPRSTEEDKLKALDKAVPKVLRVAAGTSAGSTAGAAIGAAAEIALGGVTGLLLPGVGTLAGAILGGIAGAYSLARSSSHKQKLEDANADTQSSEDQSSPPTSDA